MSFIQSLARPVFFFIFFFSQNESQRQKFIGRLVPSVMYVITRSTWSRNGRETTNLLFFLFYSLFWPFGVCKGFVFVFMLLFLSLSERESLSVLFCLVLVGLCSISSARAKSRAQALVIRSHNSVVVDIRRITCISPSLPTLLGSRSSIVFSHLNGAQVNLSETLLTEFFFHFIGISKLTENDRAVLCAFVIVYFTKG